MKRGVPKNCGKKKEKEDGNPYYSAFSTEQEPASLTSKKRWLTLCVHSVSEIQNLWAG